MRDAHAKLDGIIKPIDDAFWDKWYPPSDWRCRCDVVATAEPVTNENIDQLPKPEFQGNVGKDGEIFRKNGSFFRLIAGNDQALRNQELAKLNAPYETVYVSKAGKKLRVNIQAHSVDLDENKRIAKILIDQFDLNIDIRPHLDGRIVKNHRNPEYLINGKIGERKTPEGGNYNNILRMASKQGCEIVVIDLSLNNDSVENALHRINNILRLDNVHPTISEVYVVGNDQAKLYQRKKQP